MPKCIYQTIPQQGVWAKVYSPNAYGEYVARLYSVNAKTPTKVVPSADYFTNDQEDAINSANRMVATVTWNFANPIIQRG